MYLEALERISLEHYMQILFSVQNIKIRAILSIWFNLTGLVF